MSPIKTKTKSIPIKIKTINIKPIKIKTISMSPTKIRTIKSEYNKKP